MDYIVASALALYGPRGPTLLSYDIMCQWWVNLHKRWSAETFPRELRIELPPADTKTAIPKYHWRAHEEVGHNKYSLNLMPGVGSTDCEEPERGWFRQDGTAASTREMGPGSRHDTLEDHFGFANWQKFVGLGECHS